LRVFKSKPFARFTEREGIPDHELCDAVRRAQSGLIDDDLGGGVIKQRLARRGQGKSGGYRSIILFRRGSRAVFAYGYAKSSRQNIRGDELRVYRRLAEEILSASDLAVSAMLKNGTIKEIYCDA
jgi:hypothetical protein